MFSFFRRSKKEPRKEKEQKDSKSKEKDNTKESPPGAVEEQGNNDTSKNNQETTAQKPEIAPGENAEPLPNYSKESELQKNAPALSVAFDADEKNDTNSLLANTEPTAKMCDETNPIAPTPTVSPVLYPSFLKRPESSPASERRGSVKPCGHGTTAVTPWVPQINAKRDKVATPPSSPISEAKKQLKFVSNGFPETCRNFKQLPIKKENKPEEDKKKDTITAPEKLHVNLPVETKEKVENKEVETKNLINQETKFQSQLNELSKQLSIRDAEATKLRFQMEELQRDVFAKSAGMDRLESELNAAYKESEIIKQRIRHVESEMENYRTRNSQLNDELADKTELFNNHEKESKAKIEELEGIISQLKTKIEDLEKQLTDLQEEKVKLEERRAELLAERDEEKKKVAETLEMAIKQKQEIEKKWKQDFEKIRTINILKEQQLLDDFEWKLREVQQTCKKRLEDKDIVVEGRLKDAYDEAEKKMEQAEEMMEKLENLKVYEVEVEKLRDVTSDQEKRMKELLERQENMREAEDRLKNETKRLRNLIELEKENMQHIQRLHHQDIVDKERKLQQTLDQKRTEIAMYWEERLLRECGRLKIEMEQIHNEEKWLAMENVRKVKDEDFQKAQREWEQKLRDCLKEVSALKKSLVEKDIHYRNELIRQQTETDREIMELRRLMNKIDMGHHDKYEKLILNHDDELERINQENENKLKEVEVHWQNQVSSLRSALELVKEQMEKESQQKIESLIQQHRNELDSQWDNLIHQKGEAIQLLEEEYVTKHKTLEEQFYTQQKSHSVREVELLKTIDSLKNELESKESMMDDLQNNVDTLEGGVQVLNQEIAQQGEDLIKTKREADQKIKSLREELTKLQEKHAKEGEHYRLKYMSSQKQSQETIDHLQKKCLCLTKLFEEVRQRYERRESRQEDINKISDLKQVIAEQEKDLACINEEKRYFQMRLIALEKHLEEIGSPDEEFEDAQSLKQNHAALQDQQLNGIMQNQLMFAPQNGPVSIPPTIPECDDCDE